TEKYSRNDLIYYLESFGMEFGADINAHTSFDETVYKLQVRTDVREQMEQGIDVLNQWAFHVTFDNEEIDKERGVVLEEWRLGRGAQARMMDKTFPILFKDSKYGERLPIGKKEILTGFEYDSLKRFYRDWYRPELMAVVAVGDFNAQEIEEIIKKGFSDYHNPGISRERIEEDVPSHKKTLFSIQSDKEATSSLIELINKYEQEKVRVPSDYKLKTSEMLYYNMLNSRLNELARGENPPFLNGFAYSSSYAKAVSFSSIGALTAETTLESSLKSLLTEAARADRFGFTQGELDRAKKELASRIENYYNERDNMESIYFANDLVNAYLNGTPIPSIEYEWELYNKVLPEITMENILEVSRDLLSEENRVILITTPKKVDIPLPTEESLNKLLVSVKNETMTPYEDEFSTRELLSVIPESSEIIDSVYHAVADITEWTLANGIKVVLKPTDFKKDEILFTSYSTGGSSIIDDEDYVSAIFASSAISTCGIGDFSNVELEKQLAGNQIQVSPYISDLKEGFSGSSRPVDLEKMFQLLYLTATSPRKDDIAWNSFIQRVGDSIKNRDSDPKQRYYDLINSTMTSDHFRARPLTTELLKEVDLDTSLAIYKDRFSDFSDFTFFFTGSFTLEEIKPLIKTYLGGLPSSGREENWKDRNIRYPSGQISESISAGIEPVSMVTLVYNGKFDWSRDELYKMISLESVLQTKLTKVVREEASGVYGIGIRFSPAKYPVSDYNFRFTFSCDPTRTEELKNLVKSQVEDMRKGIFDDQMVLDVKEAQLVGYEESLEQNGWWLSQMLNVWYYGYDKETIVNKREMYESLTPEDITYAAGKYLSDVNLMEIILYPASE
ncbi:MAG: insulinase family protein, partial [Spirochaetaceae bacterium]|nr:insulinase family protein [Spirochaetaceae bacterium]